MKEPEIIKDEFICAQRTRDLDSDTKCLRNDAGSVQ